MKNVKKFDWDKYMNTASYNAVLDGMADSRLLIPTMFSPDKMQIYLKTEDIAYDIKDIEALNEKFADLLECIKNEARHFKWSFERLYLLQVDYLTIYFILNSQSALPEDYKYPEYYLKLASKEFKANALAPTD